MGTLLHIGDPFTHCPWVIHSVGRHNRMYLDMLFFNVSRAYYWTFNLQPVSFRGRVQNTCCANIYTQVEGGASQNTGNQRQSAGACEPLALVRS